MAKNDAGVSNNFYKAVAKSAYLYLRESTLYLAEETK